MEDMFVNFAALESPVRLNPDSGLFEDGPT